MKCSAAPLGKGRLPITFGQLIEGIYGHRTPAYFGLMIKALGATACRMSGGNIEAARISPHSARELRAPRGRLLEEAVFIWFCLALNYIYR